MKTHLHILLTLLVFALVCPLLKGEEDISGIPVPANLEWESLSQGIEMSWVLGDSEKSGWWLRVYLKNASNSVKDITIMGQDRGLSFFFTDSQGVQHNLHPKPQIVSPHVMKIEPSEIMTLHIQISPVDLLFLNANPVQCSIPLHDPATDQTYTLISAPRQFSTSQ